MLRFLREQNVSTFSSKKTTLKQTKSASLPLVESRINIKRRSKDNNDNDFKERYLRMKSLQRKQSNKFLLDSKNVTKVLENKYSILKLKNQSRSNSIVSYTEPTYNHLSSESSIKLIDFKDTRKNSPDYISSNKANTHNLKNFINKYFRRKGRQQLRDKYISLALKQDVISSSAIFSSQVFQNNTNKLFKLPPVVITSLQF